MVEKKDPELDLAVIDFPTDRITIRQMRERHPDLFLNIGDHGADEILALEAYDVERRVAEDEFARARGRPAPSDFSLKHWTNCLNECYTTLGLSSGMQQTRQMVRRFVEAARRQAGRERG